METPETPEASATSEASESTEKRSPKLVPVEEVQAVRARARAAEEKLAEYEAREAASEREKLTEIERYKADLDKATGELNKLKIGHARREAISKAVSEVGDGWTVDTDAIAAIVDDLIYDEKTFTDKVKRVVDTVKKPKMGGNSPIKGNMPLPKSDDSDDDGAELEGQVLSPAQVLKLSPAQYKRWLASTNK